MINSKKKISQRKYLRKIRLSLPLRYPNRRQILCSIKESIEQFSEDKEDLRYEDIVAEFGEPVENVVSLIDNYTAEDIIKKLHIIFILKAVLCLAIIGRIILGCYAHYKNTHPGFIIYETTIIYEDGELPDFEFDE